MNLEANIKQITAAQLKAMRDEGVPHELFDVRTTGERSIACIEGARHLDQDGIAYLKSLPTGTLIVFQCHHGVRSQTAAVQCAALGFTNVCNLIGGIESWSLDVDPSVARY